MSERLSKTRIQETLTRAPILRSTLIRLAKRALQGEALPKTRSIKGLDYTAQGELERLFGEKSKRKADGRVVLELPDRLRECLAWQSAIAYFDLNATVSKDETVFERLKLLKPKHQAVIKDFATNAEIVRFATHSKHYHDWLILAQGVLTRFEQKAPSAITLSQLGAEWFGDSKKLRHGTLRSQLILLLKTLYQADVEEWRILEYASIIENPYTSAVTVYAPITLEIEPGKVLDFPNTLYRQGIAAQLPFALLLKVSSIHWHQAEKVIATSENAAPFVDLVAQECPSLYTAGYPCLAVTLLLKLLSQKGITCRHIGDADLDGFCIAAEVGQAIRVTEVVASKILARAQGKDAIALTETQRERAMAFLESPRGERFDYALEVKLMLERGFWVEQERFKAFNSDDGVSNGSAK